MKNLTRFFFYYTFLACNIMVFVSLFFLETPYNLLYAVIFGPTILFFWLKITDPQGATESTWSARLVITIGILTSLSMLGTYLYRTQKGMISDLKKEVASEKANKELQIASISGELSILRKEIQKNEETKQDIQPQTQESSNSAEIQDLLKALDATDKIKGVDTKKLVIGSVKLIGNEATNLYEKNDSNAKIVGILEVGTEYEYYEYDGSWYLVKITDDRQGWVESDKVEIVIN